MGDLIKGAECKGLSSFGAFFNVNGEMDCLVHLQEIQYSRLNHPDEVLSVGDKKDLLVISVDNDKLQVGCILERNYYGTITTAKTCYMHVICITCII